MKTKSESDSPQKAVASDALLAIGDRVEIISNAMTKGKIATIVEFSNPKWEVSFSPQWCGWYLPHELRKVPCANNQDQEQQVHGQNTQKM